MPIWRSSRCYYWTSNLGYRTSFTAMLIAKILLHRKQKMFSQGSLLARLAELRVRTLSSPPQSPQYYTPFTHPLTHIRYIFPNLGFSIQTGRLNMSNTLTDWSCSSGCSPPKDCRLKMCTNVASPYTFSGSGKVSNTQGIWRIWPKGKINCRSLLLNCISVWVWQKRGIRDPCLKADPFAVGESWGRGRGAASMTPWTGSPTTD